MTTQDRFLTVEEVADKLRRSPAAIRWMRHHGNGPRSAKIGGKVLFKEADLNAWINEQFAVDAARVEEKQNGTEVSQQVAAVQDRLADLRAEVAATQPSSPPQETRAVAVAAQALQAAHSVDGQWSRGSIQDCVLSSPLAVALDCLHNEPEVVEAMAEALREAQRPDFDHVLYSLTGEPRAGADYVSLAVSDLLHQELRYGDGGHGCSMLPPLDLAIAHFATTGDVDALVSIADALHHAWEDRKAKAAIDERRRASEREERAERNKIGKRVSCPFCGSAPEEDCRTASGETRGTLRGEVHVDRYLLGLQGAEVSQDEPLDG